MTRPAEKIRRPKTKRARLTAGPFPVQSSMAAFRATTARTAPISVFGVRS